MDNFASIFSCDNKKNAEIIFAMPFVEGEAGHQGGSVVGAVSALAGTAFSIWNLYNYYKGMVATRNYVAAHKGQDTAALLEGGMNTYVNYLQKDLISAFKGICAGAAAVGLWPITALVVITA